MTLVLYSQLPIFQAVLKRNIDVVRFLVYDAGVNVNKKDIFGSTPLDSAFKLQYHDIVEILTRVPKNGNKFCKINGEIGINSVNQNNLINCKMNGESNL